MRAAEIKSAALIHFLWTETKSNSEYDQRQVQPRKSTARKKGHIIVTSSVAGTRSVPGNAVYAGTKHCVRAMLDSFRAESVMEGTHIRTTLIYPGAIKTELLNTIAPSETKKWSKNFTEIRHWNRRSLRRRFCMRSHSRIMLIFRTWWYVPAWKADQP